MRVRVIRRGTVHLEKGILRLLLPIQVPEKDTDPVLMGIETTWMNPNGLFRRFQSRLKIFFSRQQKKTFPLSRPVMPWRMQDGFSMKSKAFFVISEVTCPFGLVVVEVTPKKILGRKKGNGNQRQANAPNDQLAQRSERKLLIFFFGRIFLTAKGKSDGNAEGCPTH